MSRGNACGELGVGDERVSLSYKNAHEKRLKFRKYQRKSRTCRNLLEPIHRIAVECFEHANISLPKRAFDECPMRKQLVGKMTIEKDTLSAEHPEEGYTCRELVYEEDIVFGCSGMEELCQSEMKLPCMCKEDVEFAMPCPREG